MPESQDNAASDAAQAHARDFNLLDFSKQKEVILDYLDDTPGGDRLDSHTVERIFDPLFSQIRRLYCLAQYQTCPDGASEPDAAPLIHDAITELRETLSSVDVKHFSGDLGFS